MRSLGFAARAAATLILLLLLPILTPCAHAVAWPSEWKPFGLQGRVVRSVAGAPDLLCAGTEGQGVHCLALGGGSPTSGWVAIGPGGVTATWLWIDPVRPQHRFAAAGDSWPSPSLYRTLDGGVAWTVIDNFPSPGGRAWAVQGVPGGGPLWAAGGGVWTSSDLGNTWAVGGPNAGLDCLEIAPADPLEVWSGGETAIFMGFTVRTLDGGQVWESVWDSRGIGDNQTADVAVHPTVGGLVLSGHEGFVLRSENHGGAWQQVLNAQARFFLAWDGAAPDMAWAAGSPNGGTAHAFASRDRGRTWADITGSVLAPQTVFRISSDTVRNGVVYAATDDGVYRYYGGGAPVCLDTRAGMDSILLTPGLCPPAAPGTAVLGDAIAFDIGQARGESGHIDLGQVECLVAGGDIAFTTLDTPDPAPGRALAILARLAAEPDYGRSSDGRHRRAAAGDCP